MSTKWKNGRSKAGSGDDSSPESGESAPKPAEKPVSLAPLEFEEALKGLLKVKPGAGKLSAKQTGRQDGGRKE